MPRNRRSFSATFKSKVVLDAITGLKLGFGKTNWSQDSTRISKTLLGPIRSTEATSAESYN